MGKSPLSERRGDAGICAHSQYRCEKCSICFKGVDQLDRHRLRCLPTTDQVRIRSAKAFSGYEGVVSSQTRDKWEAYIINDCGYGRKRRRGGAVFDTAEAAAAAYAAAYRQMLEEEELGDESDEE